MYVHGEFAFEGGMKAKKERFESLTVEQIRKTEGGPKPVQEAAPVRKVWSDAARQVFYRARKVPVTMRLDADVVAWLKRDGGGYQTQINEILREQMVVELEAPRRAMEGVRAVLATLPPGLKPG